MKDVKRHGIINLFVLFLLRQVSGCFCERSGCADREKVGEGACVHCGCAVCAGTLLGWAIGY